MIFLRNFEHRIGDRRKKNYLTLAQGRPAAPAPSHPLHARALAFTCSWSWPLQAAARSDSCARRVRPHGGVSHANSSRCAATLSEPKNKNFFGSRCLFEFEASEKNEIEHRFRFPVWTSPASRLRARAQPAAAHCARQPPLSVLLAVPLPPRSGRNRFVIVFFAFCSHTLRSLARSEFFFPKI